MSIEQKIAEILAESRVASDVVEEDQLEEISLEEEELKPTDGGDEPNNKKNNVDKQEIGGKGKSANVVTKGASAPEASHIAGIKEDVAALVEGEELSEEFKEKAATIFEAAVMNRVKQEIANLNESYELKLQEEIELVTEGLVEKVDGYLDYVVEQWMEQNEIALESGMKSEILESFVGGLRTLFAEHYIDVPEEKFDVLTALEQDTTQLRSMLDEQVEVNVNLKKELEQYQINDVVEQLADGLVDTDKEKFVALVEELSFDGIDSFQKKAQTIRESYFTTKATTTVVESVVTDTPVFLSEDAPTKPVEPQMQGYLSILDKL